MNARALALGVVVAGVMFAVGRLVPRTQHDGARAAEGKVRVATTPTTSSLGSVRPQPATNGVVTSTAHRTSDAWIEAVRRDAAGANRTRQAVTFVLEGRRHLSIEIEQCLAHEQAVGFFRIAFAVDVVTTAEKITVSDARFVAMADGAPPISSSAAECLERHLAGHDVAAAEDGPLLEGFAGAVEYIAAFAKTSPFPETAVGP